MTPTLIFETLYGSRAYGLARAGSDVDLRGVIVGPRRWYLGHEPGPGSEFYTYQARYGAGRSVHHCPARLPVDVRERMQNIAIRAFLALGCRDLARADFVIGDEHDPHAITLLEINTLPGFTPTSLFPEAAAVRGISFPALCDRLARHALERGASVRQAALPLPT